ncbi:putative Primer-independent DNA polymerase PolB [Rhodovastum atsumiense]|uniref:DNA-directed DNA polymerase n=1 Tax=Rhodovastum atsumiense TaxID=504468 RepID=A0A5M6IQU5_9PROT|nr:hypothetical protein [Rhodovastum atsumiense]KAA5609845.1 hypothetical protein F1189_22405 [Rhodovastum atsumiense]CAH2603762.1 putative Primer-independent DNA polymerase PolB [Rhodovastum atsumiense]
MPKHVKGVTPGEPSRKPPANIDPATPAIADGISDDVGTVALAPLAGLPADIQHLLANAGNSAHARNGTHGLQPRQIRAKMKEQLRQQVALLHHHGSVPPPQSPPYAGPPANVGFDAEWVTWPDGRGGWWNEILCITAVVECGGRYARYMHVPRGPARKDRPTIAEFFEKTLRHAIKAGVLPSMPDRVTVFGHFIRGDLATFLDFWARKREFRGLGKTVVSKTDGHLIEVAPGTDGPRSDSVTDEPVQEGGWTRPQQLYLRAPDGSRLQVRLRFIDTIRLTPGQKGLTYVGVMNGLPKLDLHDDLGVPRTKASERPECVGRGLPARYGKERMDLVKRDFREAFDAYAFRDSEIALAHGLRMQAFARDQLGLRELPTTLAACAAALVRNLAGGSAPLAAQVGRVFEPRTYFNEAKRTYRKLQSHKPIPSPGQSIYYEFARNCYHGGRNECFYHGPSDICPWYDFDLPAAYTTALTALRPIDYDNIRPEFDPAAYGIGDMGFAWITFEFPLGTRFPCIPVRTPSEALVFPRVGHKEDRVFVCSPEIFLAVRMGAKVTIVQGFKAPWKSEERIFEKFTRLVQTRRREFPKDRHRATNELWKEIGNSAYGLLAQGLRDKRVFDPKTMRGQPLEPSALTEPFMAAWATSFIRAVLGEILAGVPSWGTVLTATTDGLLVNVPLDQLSLDGPVCAYFADLRERLFGAREVLDPTPKHGARQLISVAVRTTFTALKADGFEPVCAKGSVKPPTRSDPSAENRFMLRLYLGLRPGMTVVHEQLISAREQLTREADLHGIERTRTLNLRYDFKRRPVRPRMVRLGRRKDRIAWDTDAWESVEQAEFARVRVDGWSRDRQRVFRTMDDYRDWEAYFEASWALKRACEAAGVRTLQVRQDNAWGILKRVFLQAGRQGLWGIRFQKRGLAAVARLLSEAGFPTGKEDITYAGRRSAPLLAHCVPWVPETRALLKAILAHFPTFEWQLAFVPARGPVIDAALDPEGIALGEPGTQETS